MKKSFASVSYTHLKIPGAKDPDEFIREHGREAFAGLLERSEDHMEFTLDRIRSQFDLKTDEGRVGFLQEAAKELARLASPIEREIYASRAAESGNVDVYKRQALGRAKKPE